MTLSAENTIVAGDEYNVWYVPNNQLSLYVSSAEDVGAFLHLVTVGDEAGQPGVIIKFIGIRDNFIRGPRVVADDGRG